MKKTKVNDCLDMTEFGWYVHPTDTYGAYIEFDKVISFHLDTYNRDWYVALKYDKDGNIRCSPNCNGSKAAIEYLDHIVEFNENRLKNNSKTEII